MLRGCGPLARPSFHTVILYCRLKPNSVMENLHRFPTPHTHTDTALLIEASCKLHDNIPNKSSTPTTIWSFCWNHTYFNPSASLFFRTSFSLDYFFRAAASLQNLSERMEFSQVPPTPYMYSLPYYQQSLAEWYICYNWWTYMDTSFLPKVHNFHWGSLLVVYILWVWAKYADMYPIVVLYKPVSLS